MGFESNYKGGFNEGQDFDSGEIDPETGKRIFEPRGELVLENEEPGASKVLTPKEKLQAKRRREGACESCGSDPCLPTCDLR